MQYKVYLTNVFFGFALVLLLEGKITVTRFRYGTSTRGCNHKVSSWLE
jgi:hypothetical protein